MEGGEDEIQRIPTMSWGCLEKVDGGLGGFFDVLLV
jgi:hypothetical protein